ncbi:MAG: hypothetical protein IT449_17595 [Phycisphaerales bacterium]|nr:hypothetical protein [Phycisphaerales bacterium]
MATKASASGDNKNVIMGVVLGALVLALGAYWMWPSGEESSPPPVVNKQADPAPEEPRAKAPKGRAPDAEAEREQPKEEAAPAPAEKEPEKAPRSRPDTKAPEKINTSPPA